jgi:hypothetical protein
MTMARTVAVTKTSIAPLSTMMTKGKAHAAMTMIHLHEEQKEVVAAAKISRKMAKASDDMTLRHPHQVAPMVAAVVVADQQGHTTLCHVSYVIRQWGRSVYTQITRGSCFGVVHIGS